MKISKLFHWLYAFLMILPFLALIFNFVRFGLSGSITLTTFDQVMGLVFFPTFGGLSGTVYNVYAYLVVNVFGVGTSIIRTVMLNALTYWTIVSIIYLCFDVIMYIPLLVHRWLDKGVLE